MTELRSPLPVIAGVDGSDRAVAAARFAVDEARRRGAPLRLVAAVPWPFGVLTTSPQGTDLMTLLQASGQAALDAAAAAVTGADVDVATSIYEGDPVAVLTELAAGAQLVVLGSRGTGGVSGLLLGSTAGGLVAHAGCPVVVLPDDATVVVRGRRSVVVGVEGRPGDEDVLAFAFAEAAARGTDLLAVHAWQDVVLKPSLRSIAPLIDWARVAADEESVLADALERWREKEPDVNVREVVARDRAPRALLAAALTAELLVVGHRPRRSLGSTTHGVLHKAGCPVAVVPIPPGADR